MKTKQTLHEGWRGRAVGGPVPAEVAGRDLPAQVPGCAHTDLLSAGLIPDPYLDRNEDAMAWVGHTTWRYSTRFEAQAAGPGERADLAFLGLDTMATVELNGTVVGRTANMHRSYRFDVSAHLRQGGNELAVSFAAPLDAAAEASELLGDRPRVRVPAFNAIRKMACNFGWDWGPALTTSGIWRPVLLERWRTARIASVRPLATVTPGPGGERGAAEVAVHVEVERAGGTGVPLVVDVRLGDAQAQAEVPVGGNSAVADMTLPDVPLWWPAGYGGQPLVGVEVTLRAAGDGELLDTWSGRTGFRRVELDTTPDDLGARMALVVNGRRVLARGANWIPPDCFVSRVDRADYERGLAQAREANINLVRVWGGGIYEDDQFYNVADELGLMVWQDFALACAAYAEEEPLRSEVEAEAREAVTRLCPHPSLVLWNGCNENLWGFEEWGWQDPLAGRTWGKGYYWQLFPSVVAELDPGRPYAAGSPWSAGADALANDPRHASVHIWDVWNGEDDYPKYRQYQPHFVAEFGFQGPPAWSTLVRAVHDDPISLESPGLLAHEKCVNGIAKLDRWARQHLPVPASFEDWHWATSVIQARAVSFGLDWWRSLARCEGTVVWQLNDCWPVVSWAAVDGDGRRKPLWYALRRSYADRLLTVQPQEEGLAAVAVNDSLSPWVSSLEARRQDFAGTVLAEVKLGVNVAPGEAQVVALPPQLTTPTDARAEVLVVGTGDHRALWFWAEDKDLHLPPPDLQAAARAVAGGYEVELSATSLQRDVALLVDKVDAAAEVDDMLVTVLPGDRVRFRIKSGSQVAPARFLDPQVLRSINQLAYALPK